MTTKETEAKKFIRTCPFCDANADIVENHGMFAMKCQRCGAIGPTSKKKDQAEDNWNYRNETSAMCQALAKIQLEMAKIKGILIDDGK